MYKIKYEETSLASSINEGGYISWTIPYDKLFCIDLKKNQECIASKKTKKAYFEFSSVC